MRRSILCEFVENDTPEDMESFIDAFGATQQDYNEALELAFDLDRQRMTAVLLSRVYTNTTLQLASVQVYSEMSFGVRNDMLVRSYNDENLDTMQTLLEAGASPDVRIDDAHMETGNNEKLIVNATIRGRLGAVEILCEYGASLERDHPHEPPLMEAVLHNQYEIADVMLQYGASPDAKGPTRNAYDADYSTWHRPLLTGYLAVRHGEVRMVELLLRYDMDINLINSNGATMLGGAMLRIIDGDVKSGEDMLKLLISYNIDFDIQDVQLDMQEEVEQYYGNEEWLLLHEDIESRLPPHVSELLQRARTVQSLEYLQTLENEQLDVCGKFGDTALHRAAENGQLEQVLYLIHRGANVTIWDQFGRLPSESAEHRRDVILRASSVHEDDNDFYAFVDPAVEQIMEDKILALETISELLWTAYENQKTYEHIARTLCLKEMGRAKIPRNSKLGKIVSKLPRDLMSHVMSMGMGSNTFMLQYK